jgi:hypothetical protein
MTSRISRNVLAHAGKQGRRVVAAFIATAFAQDDAEAARTQWRQVADQLRPRVPKLAVMMDEAETDVLAYMTFPAAHRPKLHSTNPIERLNGEIKRRTEIVGIFPNEDAIIRLVGAILLEKNDEWAVQRARYMTLETIAPLRSAKFARRAGYIAAAFSLSSMSVMTQPAAFSLSSMSVMTRRFPLAGAPPPAPCIRQTSQPLTAGDRQGFDDRFDFARHRLACASSAWN